MIVEQPSAEDDEKNFDQILHEKLQDKNHNGKSFNNSANEKKDSNKQEKRTSDSPHQSMERKSFFTKSNPRESSAQRGSTQLFFRDSKQQKRESGQFFNPFRNSLSLNRMSSSGMNFLNKSSRNFVPGTNCPYEQNIKKFKEILSETYNSGYSKKKKNSRNNRDSNNLNVSTTNLSTNRISNPLNISETTKMDNRISNNLNVSNSSKVMENFERHKNKSFQANRLVFFNKDTKPKGGFSKLGDDQYMTHFTDSNIFWIYQLKNLPSKSIKPIKVTIPSKLIENCASLEYDTASRRIFFFNNSTQEINVIGIKSKEVICRVKVKHVRKNPLLYYHRIEENQYLMVIGGEQYKGEGVVEGSQYVEIFAVSKWEISLSQLVLRLNIGRISPVIFCDNQEGESFIYIIGGNSNAWYNIKKKQELMFTKDSDDLNSTTNQTGIRIKSSFIEQCFQKDDNNVFLLNNLNIRFENPLQLYDGCVFLRKFHKQEKMELFLSQKKSIYNIKIKNKDVHIIQSELCLAKEVKIKSRLRLHIGFNKNVNGNGNGNGFHNGQNSHVIESPYCLINDKGEVEEIELKLKMSEKTCSCTLF